MRKFNMYFDKHLLYLCLFGLFWLGLNIVAIKLNTMPCNDVATRYAPLAEEFAKSNFQNAFHPRFGIFFSGLAGMIVYLTELDGFRACQAAAIILYLLAAFPVYWLTCRIWNKRVATYNVVLYLMYSHLLRLAWEGLRDTGKTLGFMLMSYGIITIAQEYSKKRGYLSLAIGGAILVTIKGDGALIALFIFMLVFILEFKQCYLKIWRTYVAIVLCILIISPQLIYNAYLLGYPVPEVRHAQLLKRLGVTPLKKMIVEYP